MVTEPGSAALRVRCAMCRFPDDVAKMKSDTACCTGCHDECVCLDRVWYGSRHHGR